MSRKSSLPQDTKSVSLALTPNTRIVDGHRQSRLDELLPWAYPATRELKAVA
jgi:hypothetical protein